MVFTLPLRPGEFRLLVFTISVFTFALAAGNTTASFGPNFSWSKINQFEPSALFAANHTLVAGDWIKLVLW